MKKLQERRNNLSAQEYMDQMEDIRQDLLSLGEWWRGRENELFGK